ncbi:MAG TPA: hypothetical protein ENN38_06565 [Actinobacteria bacterium]|nr:hypothetical protein [Actinomycetota bacterium]
MQPVSGLSFLISPAQTSEVTLRLGEILLGKIVASFGNKVIISLRGGNLLAETNLTLFPGDFIKVRVDELKKGKIILKFLGRGGESQISQSAKETPGRLSNPNVLFSIPVQFGDEVKHAQIGIFKQKEGDEFLSLDKSSYTLVLFLDMPNIGPMNVLLEVIHGDINCRMEVENETIEKHISNHIRDLIRKLEEFDYVIKEMVVSASERKTEPLFNKISVDIQV